MVIFRLFFSPEMNFRFVKIDDDKLVSTQTCCLTLPNDIRMVSVCLDSRLLASNDGQKSHCHHTVKRDKSCYLVTKKFGEIVWLWLHAGESSATHSNFHPRNARTLFPHGIPWCSSYLKSAVIPHVVNSLIQPQA